MLVLRHVISILRVWGGGDGDLKSVDVPFLFPDSCKNLTYGRAVHTPHAREISGFQIELRRAVTDDAISIPRGRNAQSEHRRGRSRGGENDAPASTAYSVKAPFQ